MIEQAFISELIRVTAEMTPWIACACRQTTGRFIVRHAPPSEAHARYASHNEVTHLSAGAAAKSRLNMAVRSSDQPLESVIRYDECLVDSH